MSNRPSMVSATCQSRLPVFYRDWQVADTMDGRFDIIVLHLFLVLSALEEEKEFARALTETFFSDMDRSLREMGAGDTGVGIRDKNMAQAFYGRLKAYGDAATLEEALRRNVWREKPVKPESVASLADYMRRNREALQTQSPEALMQGEIIFLSYFDGRIGGRRGCIAARRGGGNIIIDNIIIVGGRHNNRFGRNGFGLGLDRRRSFLHGRRRRHDRRRFFLLYDATEYTGRYR